MSLCITSKFEFRFYYYERIILIVLYPFYYYGNKKFLLLWEQEVGKKSATLTRGKANILQLFQNRS